MGESDFNRRIGTEIRSIRMACGLSQEGMMAKGFTAQQLSRWENGRGTPNAYNLHRLAKAFECNIDDFYRSLK